MDYKFPQIPFCDFAMSSLVSAFDFRRLLSFPRVFIAFFPSSFLNAFSFPHVVSLFLCLSLVFQCVDVSADLQSRSQFYVHAGHQMVLGEQQQSLAVDLLHPESLRYVTAA